MIVHQILTAKGEKIMGEIEEYSIKLVDLLGTKKQFVHVKENNPSTDSAA